MPQSACPATPFWVSHALKFNLECLPATNVFKPKERRNKNQMRNCRVHGYTLPLDTEIVWFWRFSSLPGNHHPNTCPAVSSLSPLSCLLHPPQDGKDILPYPSHPVTIPCPLLHRPVVRHSCDSYILSSNMGMPQTGQVLSFFFKWKRSPTLLWHCASWRKL